MVILPVQFRFPYSKYSHQRSTSATNLIFLGLTPMLNAWKET